MKSLDNTIFWNRLAIPTVLLLALCMSNTAVAKHANNMARQQPISVIAHLALPETPAKQMLLQQQKGHEYLYLVRSSGKGFTVLDVTKPDKPSIVKKMTLPLGTSTQTLDLVGTTMAVVEQSDTDNGISPEHPETIQLLDLSDPANPHPLQTFTGVTSFLSENGRHLVYVYNKDGLWILRRPTKPTTHPCTSSDAISGYPECE